MAAVTQEGGAGGGKKYHPRRGIHAFGENRDGQPSGKVGAEVPDTKECTVVTTLKISTRSLVGQTRHRTGAEPNSEIISLRSQTLRHQCHAASHRGALFAFPLYGVRRHGPRSPGLLPA